MKNPKILQTIFDLTNEEHFDNQLPKIKLEWNKRTSSAGIFHAKIVNRNIVTDKIGMSLYYFNDKRKNDKLDEIIKTMAHELVHYWQVLTNNKLGHNFSFYEKMKLIGLPVTNRYCEDVSDMTIGKRWAYICKNDNCVNPMKNYTVKNIGDNKICNECGVRIEKEYIGDLK